MWKNNNYTLYYEASPFFRHEQIILAAGAFEGYLPMSFLRGSHGLTARYETGGYLPLSGYRIERTEDVLYLMERTVQVLHESPEHLLAPERIILRTSTVFYNKDRDDLRIAFIPRSGESSGSSGHSVSSQSVPSSAAFLSPMQRELLSFLAQLKQDIRDQHTSFILRLARDLYYNRPTTSDMLRSIGLLRRELDALAKPDSI